MVFCTASLPLPCGYICPDPRQERYRRSSNQPTSLGLESGSHLGRLAGIGESPVHAIHLSVSNSLPLRGRVDADDPYVSFHPSILSFYWDFPPFLLPMDGNLPINYTAVLKHAKERKRKEKKEKERKERKGREKKEKKGEANSKRRRLARSTKIP